MSSQDDVVPGDRVPQDDEPGAGSTPGADGEGVVDIGDRTDDGAPAANQSKTEPMPPGPAHGDPAATPAAVELPDLDSMNVGAGDPQAPSHPAAGAAASRAGSGIAATETPVGSDRDTAGSAFRVPGSLGAPGVDEQVDTDTELSAARTNVVGSPGAAAGAGDASSVPVVSEEPSPGTSQESAEAQGSRTPL